jgi:hypothetical protein
MGEVSPFAYFKAVLLCSFLFGFGVTLLAYSLPGSANAYGQTYKDGVSASGLGYEDIALEVEGSFNQQLNIPVIELGSLVYYSGNILVDLLVNFATAIPQILTILINGLVTVLGGNIDIGLLAVVQGFLTAAIFAFYVLGVVSLLSNLRSGTGVV